MMPNERIRADAVDVEAVALRLEALRVHAPENLGASDLHAIGVGYIASAVLLERLAQRFKDRGAAYLGL